MVVTPLYPVDAERGWFILSFAPSLHDHHASYYLSLSYQYTAWRVFRSSSIEFVCSLRCRTMSGGVLEYYQCVELALQLE